MNAGERLLHERVFRNGANEQDRPDQRDEFVARWSAEKTDLRIALGAALVLSDEGDGGDAIDAILARLIGFEDEVHLLDQDPVAQRGKLVENLPRLNAG